MNVSYLLGSRVMKSLLLTVVVGTLGGAFLSAQAATISGTLSNLNLTIPDASTGTVLPSTIVLNSGGQLISSLRISVTVTGGSNGDLYILLEHGGKSSVLVNRPGLDTTVASSSYGSPSRGLNVTFFDAAPVDLKTSIPMSLDASYGAGGANDGQAQVTGVFQPDGRDVSPFSADLNSPATATRTLAEFNNMAVDGPWTLSLVRIDSLETSTLESWSVEATSSTVTVPEPGTVLPSMLLVCSGLYVRFIRRHRTPRHRSKAGSMQLRTNE
jgi:hypothetical protein